MIFWLLAILLSYLFFSVAFFGDKLILSSRPNAKLYTFYVGLLNILVVIFIPFTKFSFPNHSSIIWIILDAIAYILALYTMFLALEKFDVSKVIPTIGAIQPIVILLLTWFFWGAQAVTRMNVLAFIILLAGSIMISIEKKLSITTSYLVLIFCSALLFSLDYVFSKMVFLYQPFLQGLIWMRTGSFLLILMFLFNKELRGQVFSKKVALDKKTGILFLCTQLAGGIAGVLQSFAISLVPISYLAIVNSLKGVQYIFLFLITLFFSFFFPRILKEDISKKIIIQKVVSIVLIIIGLAILILY